VTDALVRTSRISVPVAIPEEIDAVISGDRDRFRELTGVEPPDPLIAPPETGDVLEFFRDAMVADPEIRTWFFRWIVDHQSANLIGSAGFGDRPDADGVVLIGYSVYPEFERRGYATEAARALTEWAFRDARVQAVRATILPQNIASCRVAIKAGMTFKRIVETDEDGMVELWEIARPIVD